MCLNVDKTNAIWIGSLKESYAVLCSDLNLALENETFNLLGVTFSKNLADMVDLNYSKQIEHIESLFKCYSKRFLTHIGKIVVIKFGITKINHLIMSLPNLSEETIQKIQNLCFICLRNNGPDKVKRNCGVKSYMMGGLKMLDAKNFTTSLKATWLRRLLCKRSKYFDFLYTTYTFVSKISCFERGFYKKETTFSKQHFLEG